MNVSLAESSMLRAAAAKNDRECKPADYWPDMMIFS
jgi:hypothetical protein